MKFDSIPLNSMSPDTSLYEKGVTLAVNVVPVDGGGWREIAVPSLFGSVTLPDDSSNVGTFSDPVGSIFVGTTRPTGPSSRLYEYAPLAQTFTNVTPGTNYAGAPERWRFAKFGSSVIAAPTNNGTGTAIQLQSRAGSGNFANLVTSVDRPAPKFITVSRSHLVGAHNLANGGAGVYASADPYQFMWSARNNAAEMTPGTDRAGFGRVNDANGEIVAVAGFKEFFLLFQEFGVTRATWIGGDAVWELQEIASSGFGIANAAWQDSIVVSDRDVYYLANSGPAVIRNGEAAEILGAGATRRYLTDLLDGDGWAPDPMGTVVGVFDVRSNCVVWSYSRLTAVRACLLYHPPTDRFSLVTTPESEAALRAEGVGLARKLSTTYQLAQIVLFAMQGSDLQALRFDVSSLRETLEMYFLTKRWRAGTGQRHALHSIRPLLVLDLASGGDPYPTVSVLIYGANEPRFAAPDTGTVTSASMDDNGWLTDSFFPREAAEFYFEIRVPSLGHSNYLVEIPALELAYEVKSVF